jgi:hypothetical protein
VITQVKIMKERRVFDPKSTERHQQPATTDSGASVEEQVRKEWNPKMDGGLPVF